MPKNTDSIEREIEEARNQLASTLDQLSVKANPQKIVDDTKKALIDTIKQPKIMVPVVGTIAVIGGGVAFFIVRRIYRSVFSR